MLNYRLKSNGSKQLLIILHGFLGSKESFQDIINRPQLKAVDMLILDLPGHGEDGSPDVEWNFDYIAEEMHRLVRALSEYEKIYLYGYSMGGRVALYYALKYSVDGLILESTSPGIMDETEREKRRQIDEHRGNSIISDYQAFIDDWEQLPLFQTYHPLQEEVKRKQRHIRLSHEPALLAKALRDYGTGSQPDLWPQLSTLNIPVLLLTGVLDEKFVNINQKMHELISGSTHIIVDAGHTIHVEHPEIFDTIVIEFIKEAHHG